LSVGESQYDNVYTSNPPNKLLQNHHYIM